jgi:Amt family ammonium transporter
MKQVAAVIISSIWAFGFTYGALWLINKFTPVRVEKSDETNGLDSSLLGEVAYIDEETDAL